MDWRGYALTSILLTNLWGWVDILVIFFPYQTFLYIRQEVWKRSFFIGYTVLLIPILPALLLATLLAHGDLNNGWIPQCQHVLDANRSIILYRTPDLGATGGGKIEAALVRAIFPGVIQRTRLSSKTWSMVHGNTTAWVAVSVDDGEMTFECEPPTAMLGSPVINHPLP